MLTLRSPEDDQSRIPIPEEISHLSKVYHGVLLAGGSGEEYPVEDNIIDLLKTQPLPLSWAQKSNNYRLSAVFYEKAWRLKSIRILSGKKFSMEDEITLLMDWLKPRPKGVYLDIGCATALYARSIYRTEPGSVNVALDFSLPMLQKARDKAMQENGRMYLVRANAGRLPFFDDTFDGLVCGGTLNELSEPLKAMEEARRVIKNDGVFFIMYLLRAETGTGRVMQRVSSPTGLTFYTTEESDTLFNDAGFRVDKRKNIGVVSFTRLLPA